MRRQLLIPQEKIPSLSRSNLQPSSFLHQRILHNKRVTIRLLFQATKGHHISLSFSERICFHFAKQPLLFWEKRFFYPSFFTSSFSIYAATVALFRVHVAGGLKLVDSHHCKYLNFPKNLNFFNDFFDNVALDCEFFS